MWYSKTMNENAPKSSLPSKRVTLAVISILVVIIAGSLAGWLVAGKKPVSKSTSVKGTTITVSPNEAGITDVSKYPAGPIGVLKSGGIKGEGTYHLVRPGGDMQTVYLTSTVVKLGSYVDKKVQVWGETLAAKYAPWFMDVVKIKVVE